MQRPASQALDGHKVSVGPRPGIIDQIPSHGSSERGKNRVSQKSQGAKHAKNNEAFLCGLGVFARRFGLRNSWEALYFLGGLIMMWAPGVPGYISHGPGPGVVESPVDSGVA